MTKNRSKLIFFIAAVLWGASYSIQKPFLEHINPITYTFWSFFLSGIIFLVYAIYKKIPITYRWREGIILGIFVSGMEILEMVGLNITSSANTVFITNFGMLLVPYIGYLMYKDKIKIEDNLAIIMATIGMYLLVGGLNGFGVGEIILLVSALSSAFYFIYSERFEGEKATHMTTLCLQQFFVITLICLIWGLMDNKIIFAVDEPFRLTLLWQVILFTTIPYAIIQWSSRWADEITAAIYDGVVEPLVGAVFAWYIFQEVTSATKIFGGMLMIISFVIASIISEKHFLYIELKKIKFVLSKKSC